MRNLLVIGQIAGSVMLLIVAGLFVRSLGQARRLDLGFDPDRLLNVVVDPKQIGYSQSRTVEFYSELEDRIRMIHGVESTTLAFSVPMGVNNDASPITIEGRPNVPGLQPPMVLFNSIYPNYFRIMRIPLLRGRVFSEFDNETAPQVAIINQTMASQFWPNEDPIGKRFSVKSIGGASMQVNVVGVAANSKYMSITEEPIPYFYVPLRQNFMSMRALQIRTSVPPLSVINSVRKEINRFAPELPISELRTMREGLEGTYGLFIFRQASIWAGAIGFFGLILALVGIYGIISYAVAQRTHEIGIRIAIGATRWNTLNLILWQGARLTIAGVLLGMLAAYTVTHLMTNLLIGVSPADPITFLTVTVLLTATALCACIFPARKAVLLNPITALRHE
jgi:putative ABC transport system permease protein